MISVENFFLKHRQKLILNATLEITNIGVYYWRYGKLTVYIKYIGTSRHAKKYHASIYVETKKNKDPLNHTVRGLGRQDSVICVGVLWSRIWIEMFFTQKTPFKRAAKICGARLVVLSSFPSHQLWSWNVRESLKSERTEYVDCGRAWGACLLTTFRRRITLMTLQTFALYHIKRNSRGL